jgi:hypothetical protein
VGKRFRRQDSHILTSGTEQFLPSEAQQIAKEVFLTTAGPALVKRVVEILNPLGIPVMPLKGVLLQKLVYGEKTFRSISDVDLLVPEDRFLEAKAALEAGGFSKSRWERGRWQAALWDPNGPPLGIDLHRVLSRTPRSKLTTGGLFERGSIDSRLFGVPVYVPCGNDLFAHLLLHATLHWINKGELHRLDDFQAIADALSLEVQDCAKHLHAQGLDIHALVLLPKMADASAGGFATQLTSCMTPSLQSRAAAATINAVCERFECGHPSRRIVGLTLVPSISEALGTAVRDRFRESA